MSIPKIIHQTFGSSQLPDELSENIAKIKALNPGWEYRFYDDVDMIGFIAANYDSHVVECFNRINPVYGAARADLFRYLLVYKCGGVYLDIKSSLRLPLDSILRDDDQYLLSHWQAPFANWGEFQELSHIARGEFQQWHIIATPGHPFLESVIKYVLNKIDCYTPGVDGVGRYGVLRVTGPIAYTLAIEPLLKLHPHRFAESDGELGFEYNIISASTNPVGHRALFKNHYTTLTEPLIIRPVDIQSREKLEHAATTPPSPAAGPFRVRRMGAQYDAAGVPTRSAVPPVKGATIAIITICKGRLDHLKQTLPLMLDQAADELVVVDYGCPQGTGDWVEKNHPQCKVVRVTDDQNFSASRARNIGAAATTAKWLCCLDADILVRPGWLDWLRPRLHNENTYFRANKLNSSRLLESYGMACVSHSAFDSIGGYDEAFRGWGVEDDDFFIRLKSGGFREDEYPFYFIGNIPHEDDRRTQFHEIKDKEISRRAGIFYLEAKKTLAKVLSHDLTLAEREQLMQIALSETPKLLQGTPQQIPSMRVRFDTDRDIVTNGARYRFRKELVLSMVPVIDDTLAAQAPKNRSFPALPPLERASTAAWPMISCLMVTKGRPEFVKQAINSFIVQTYPNKELVIVCDAPGDDVKQLVNGLGRQDIRLVQLTGQTMSLGELRNLSVSNASGQFVCQWDDDDIYDPQRLEFQFCELAKSGAQACLLKRWVIWWPNLKRLAVSPYRNWEGSLLCDKSVMPEYPALRYGEDTPVVEKLLETVRAVTIDMPYLYMYVVHGNNTFEPEHFEEMYHEATDRIEGDFYHAELNKLKRRMDIEGYPAAS